jgi:hypothetical protein
VRHKCVGCERVRDDCRKTWIDWVCGDCDPELRAVMRWQKRQKDERETQPSIRVWRVEMENNLTEGIA